VRESSHKLWVRIAGPLIWGSSKSWQGLKLHVLWGLVVRCIEFLLPFRWYWGFIKGHHGNSL